MEYTSIHVYGHLLSDELLRQIETDKGATGNREMDFRLDTPVQEAIDYAWTSLRSDWNFYQTRSAANDPYGTRRAREFMERFLLLLGYHPQRQQQHVESDTGTTHDITWLCPDVRNLPVIVRGDKIGDTTVDSQERCSLDFRMKGNRREKSAHATMLEYLNNTENIYGIIANGPTLRLIRNSGQLVKLSYVEFDLRRMLEEDKYAEFCLMFRILHASRFHADGDVQPIIEKYFNLSIESGNRIRAGLSQAAQKAMTIIGKAAVSGDGEGNDRLRSMLAEGALTTETFNKELMHLIYRLLFLFIIEERGLVYDGDAEQTRKWKEIYYRHYAASRYRTFSEIAHVRSPRYFDLWEGLMETFRLFEDGDFGAKLGIKPLGGVLFDSKTLFHLRDCRISNRDVFDAFRALNMFEDEQRQMVRINYSSLDVEEFGSVYEGILEKRPYLTQGASPSKWNFDYVGGLDRQSTSSYYTRPDLVHSLIRTTLEPVIKERISKFKTSEEKVASLLSMKVCDAASGSGHIVLAMARTIAWYVCSIRTGEDNPASMDYRRALHEVIERCVYAVDYNPDAVELCKVVLWIEGYCAGKPLSFLDHHIRCGNSVVGITNLDMLLEGVPDKAFTAEAKDTLKAIKALNKKAVNDAKRLREKTSDNYVVTSLFGGEYNITRIEEEQISLAAQVKDISSMPENDLLEQLTKQNRWEDLMKSPRVESLRRACDIYTDAFYHIFTETDVLAGEDGVTMPDIPYTATVYQALEEIKQIESPDNNYVPLTEEFKESIAAESSRQRFFHWCVEFPEVFADGGGFDVMCGNPPWDKLQMEDEKWFLGKDNEIVDASNQSARDKKIKALQISNPRLYAEYQEARHDISSQSNFVKNSGRFTLTNCGKIELSSLFAEICLQFSKEAWGLVLPTGIAVNDSNKAFFSKLVEENRLISLFDFENREALFDIHRMFKFCLLTAGKEQDKPRSVQGGFYLTRLDHLLDPNRIYTLQTSDFSLLNPNTKTCPTFRTSKDAELTAKIYRNCGHIIENEKTGENPWKLSMLGAFNMASDSSLFRTYSELSKEGYSINGYIMKKESCDSYVPLYEGKMFWIYNNHFGSYPLNGERPNAIESPSILDLKNTNGSIVPWYWVPEKEVNLKMGIYKRHGSYLVFRKLTNATNERTLICAAVPDAFGVGHSTTAFGCGAVPELILQSQLSSFVLDYVARQKVGGTNLSHFFFKQFPILAPDQIPEGTKWEMAKRVIELTYFNHDMDAWAEELWGEMTETQREEMPKVGRKEPFIFDPERRAVLQAELDAIVGHLYGLTTDEMRYILDPEDICGKGCINETFRVLKERELRELGEYRTKRLVMEAWDRFGYHN